MSSPRTKKSSKNRQSKSSFPVLVLREPSSNLFPTKYEVLKLFAVVAIATSVAYACNYVVVFLNRQPKPFCDSGDLLTYENSELCEPCPENGYCSNGELVCSHGYKKLGRKCMEDGEVNQTARMLTELIEERVCTAYAQDLCDKAGKIWFQEADIMNILDEEESRPSINLKNDVFLLVRQKVMETIEKSLEKRSIAERKTEYKCPDSRVKRYKPSLCSVRHWLVEHYFIVLSSSAAIFVFLKFIVSFAQKRYISVRAEQLYEQVCEILEDNAMKNEGSPWVVASWLRDHLLLPKERRHSKLWKKVEELLLEDSRIDQYPKLIKGESKIVLEWQVDRSLSAKMRAKRAVSKIKPGSVINTSSTYQQREALCS